VGISLAKKGIASASEAEDEQKISDVLAAVDSSATQFAFWRDFSAGKAGLKCVSL
jgi:hypothetical protein